MRYVLGIDAGGTKTVCLLADDRGAVVSSARGRGGNLQALGSDGLAEVLAEVIELALAGHHIQPAAICLGIAGVDRQSDREVSREIVRRLGFDGRVIVLSDAAIALAAGAPGSHGVVLTVGTGSMAYGRSPDGRTARAGGLGHLLSDEGSGYWIGRRALRAVVREADGRGPRTTITPRVLAHFGVSQPADLIYQVYGRDVRPADIAALARAVSGAREEGDPEASGLLARASQELSALGEAVVERLGMRELAFPFVLSGGVFEAVPWLVGELGQRLGRLAPCSRVGRLSREPAEGAVGIAIEALAVHG